MFTLFVVVVYTILVLLFVPLDKIGQYQLQVKATTKRWMDKINK